MFKKDKIHLAVTAALVMSAGSAVADIEISGYLKNESAIVTSNEQFIGEAKSTVDTESHHDRLLKFENTARVFMNGEFGEESSWHVDLNLVYDAKGVESEYRGHEEYTQNDWLKEAYIDTRWGDTDIRIGKQQVVWGTADGIKLLDIVNPTDFREFNQNTPAEARIPIWMINVDTPIGESGSLQFILSEHEENKFPGLDKDGDTGHPFTVMGVDSISGQVNGFRNVAPALSRVAASFTNTTLIGGFDTTGNGAGNPTASGLTGFSGLSVDGFASANQNVNNINTLTQNISAPGLPAPAGSVAVPGATLLNSIAQNGINPAGGDTNANANVTNLVSAAYDAVNPNEAFEYMPNASFATFNTFAGSNGNAGAGFATGNFAGFRSDYVRDYPDDGSGNFGMRYRNSTDGGLNFSFNYLYHYDSNPSVGLSYHDSSTGEQLTTVVATSGDFNNDGRPDFADPNGRAPGVFAGQTITSDAQIPTDLSPANVVPVTVLLRNAAGQYYGGLDPTGGFGGTPLNTTGAGGAKSDPVLRFTEKLNRIHSVGGSFDYSVDSLSVPLVIRGEAVYDQDVLLPQVNKLRLGIGDLENALTNTKHDMFKYVLGFDFTVATNMLFSTQFIQFRDLDFKDTRRTCITDTGASFDCSTYTADAATLHLSNGLQKAEKTKEFVSIFLSKPFGSDQQGRWNNILILEDTGGKWNRFDVEYGFSDELIGSFEVNAYWGEQDSLFGQLHNSSNIQVGLKYLFE